MGSTARHSWQKLKEHTYICRSCGLGKINEGEGRDWIAVWHLPDGTVARGGATPSPCAPGPLTAQRLAKLRGETPAPETCGVIKRITGNPDPYICTMPAGHYPGTPHGVHQPGISLPYVTWRDDDQSHATRPAAPGAAPAEQVRERARTRRRR